jgi:hypothetical protein
MCKCPQRQSLRNRAPLLVIATLLFCFVSTGLATAQTKQESFRFGEVDLEFLDQIKQLDKRFEEQGLVYREPQLKLVDMFIRNLKKLPSGTPAEKK